MSDLFREQAVEARQSRWAGDVSSIRPVQVWVSADIELDRRRLIDWMFAPLYALGQKL